MFPYPSQSSGYYPDLVKKQAMPLPEVLVKYARGLVEIGLTNPQRQSLGRGAFGAAYKLDTKPPSVIKLTRDPAEAVASCILAGRKLKHVVNLHCVWVLKGSKRPGDELEWFAIHREYLRRLHPKERELMEVALSVYEDVDALLPVTRVLRRRWERKLASELRPGRPTGPRDRARLRSELDEAMAIVLQVADGWKELRDIGFEWMDFHPGNVLRAYDEEKFKIADIGHGIWRAHYDVTINNLYPDGFG